MKYIDSKKLIDEIERLQKGIKSKWNENPRSSIDDGFLTACSQFLSIITSLQQEQSEVDLEEELRNYNVPFNDCGWERLTYNTLKDIARHFAEWGAIHLNARKEE